MKFLFNMLMPEQIDIFGLDIGSKTVKAVKLRQTTDGRYQAANIGFKRTAERNDSMGESSKDVVHAIEACLKDASLHSQYAVCAVNGPEVAIRTFEFPKIPLEEIPKAVLLEAEQVCPFEIKSSIVDYNLVEGKQGKISGVLVAATADAITKKSMLAKKASLQPVLMDSESLAILNCFNYCVTERPKTHGILNIGSSDATMIINSNGDVPFVRTLQFTGSDIINWLCDNNDLNAEQAYEKVFTCPDDYDLQLASDLTCACANLVNNVSETLRYYSSEKNQTVEKIYLCGGFSCSQNVVDILEKSLLCDVELWNPFDSIECEDIANKEKVKKYGPSLVVAAGLAMRKV